MTYAEILIKKGKRGAAAFVQAECMSNKAGTSGATQTQEVHQIPQHLQALLDHLLHPEKDINDTETVDWCRWLVGGGRTPDDFSHNVQEYNNTVMCGLVWTANFVAFRCQTCRISQCMSLCADCFRHGNHEGHDYNMFKSQAGGACDCGDASVMRESGFCSRHGPNACRRRPGAPAELMCVAENMLPKMILRLLQHLRDKSIPAVAATPEELLESYKVTIEQADKFLNLLHEFCDMGTAMRSVITRCLVNTGQYQNLTEHILSDDSEYANFMRRSADKYSEALNSLPNPDPPPEFCDCPALTARLTHHSFLEELVFWTVKYEFPQKLVCLLLNMLPDSQYKEAFTRAFVLHYSRMSMMLVKSSNSDSLSNRVVHVSVQLFSNEELALRMTDNLYLLHIMVSSLKNMMSNVLTQNTLGDLKQNYHEVVDCAEHVMKDHCYWPLVSDLNNVLSHPPIAYRFMRDEKLLNMWFDFLSMFQGMNVNVREMESHIEFEPNTYYAAFSAELEASASPMWALVSHLKDNSTRQLTLNVIKQCLAALKDWFDAIYFSRPDQVDALKVSFHLPLHRYFSVFVRQAVKLQGFSLAELLPDTDTLHLMMMHPLRVQTAFYEIMCHMWVRNGLQIKGQAMTYIQCHFCNSMVDADMFLLQLCATRLEPSIFLSAVLDRFHALPWLSLSGEKEQEIPRLLDQEQEVPIMESALIFLASLITLRTNLGLSEQNLTRLEMVTLLCMGDKTHSLLSEHMPEKCGSGVLTDDFERVLAEVGQFREPQFEPGGNMQQGMYVPKPEVWETMYDPIYVLLRAVHRRDFQNSIDRFNTYAQQNGRVNTSACSADRSPTPWPPWRLPPPCDPLYQDPRLLLHSKFAHGLIFNLLYKAVHGNCTSENITSLTVFLLELSLSHPQTQFSGQEVALSTPTPWFIVHEPVDLQYDTWFPTDWLSANLRHTVTALFSTQPIPTHTSMEVDQVSDGSTDDSESTPYNVETPTSVVIDGPGSPPLFRQGDSLAITMSQASALVPVMPGTVDTVNSLSMVPPSGQSTSTSQPFRPADRVSILSGREVVPVGEGHLGPVHHAGAAVPGHPGTNLPEQAAITSPTQRSVVNINDSIVSLLVKLHSKLSGKPDSYTPMAERRLDPALANTITQQYNESRIGDGCFFIEKVLDKICDLDVACEQFIKVTRAQLWPTQHAREAQQEEMQEKEEAEARRRRARERQAKMMRDFAEKQHRFMKTAMETATDDGEEEVEQTGTNIRREYDCVHCHQTQTSTEDKPMGLVVLLQATSVLGHKHRDSEGLVLPTRPEEKAALAVEDSLAAEYESRFEELSRHFDTRSHLLAVNTGWQGGVFVQSCGHHVHLACHQSYMQSLRGTGARPTSQTLAVDRGEYMCPMCRQLANSVLPIPPDMEGQVVRARSQCAVILGHEVTALLREPPLSPSMSAQSQLMHAMSQIMENLTKATYPQYRQVGSPQRQDLTNHAVILFVSSIARTNLELDLVTRGGVLITAAGATASPVPSTAKPRSCFLPLLHVLAIHMKIMSLKPLVSDWCQVSGLWQDEDDRTLLVRENDVPVLLRDPTTLLLHFSLILPVQIDRAFFTTIVRQVYNLCWTQACLKLACRLPTHHRTVLRDEWRRQANNPANHMKVDTLGAGLGIIIATLDSSGLFNDDVDHPRGPTADSLPHDVTFDQLEARLQANCLPYLRIASLLRHYIYNEPLPDIWEADWEFTRLAQFLGMADMDMSGRVASAPCLGWLVPPAVLVSSWATGMEMFATKSQLAARKLVLTNNIWRQPQLLRLPRNYDAIFQFYHKRECTVCQRVPKDPTLCLLCGVMVCLREACCRPPAGDMTHEAVRHSIDCGAGTAPFLAVNSATIVVIRGKRACIWGSIYLDAFGEEDRELKRGKPLFLNPERYQLLETQWLSHRFDHTNRKWIWHRDQL